MSRPPKPPMRRVPRGAACAARARRARVPRVPRVRRVCCACCVCRRAAVATEKNNAPGSLLRARTQASALRMHTRARTHARQQATPRDERRGPFSVGDEPHEGGYRMNRLNRRVVRGAKGAPLPRTSSAPQAATTPSLCTTRPTRGRRPPRGRCRFLEARRDQNVPAAVAEDPGAARTRRWKRPSSRGTSCDPIETAALVPDGERDGGAKAACGWAWASARARHDGTSRPTTCSRASGRATRCTRPCCAQRALRAPNQWTRCAAALFGGTTRRATVSRPVHTIFYDGLVDEHRRPYNLCTPSNDRCPTPSPRPAPPRRPVRAWESALHDVRGYVRRSLDQMPPCGPCSCAMRRSPRSRPARRTSTRSASTAAMRRPLPAAAAGGARGGGGGGGGGGRRRRRHASAAERRRRRRGRRGGGNGSGGMTHPKFIM